MRARLLRRMSSEDRMDMAVVTPYLRPARTFRFWVTWQCPSMRPGIMKAPLASMTCAPSAASANRSPSSSKSFCFSYLLSQFTKLNEEQNLSHPALAVLKRHDWEKNTDYYRTLFVYLLYERSILLGAEQLHIHKNSFLYRIQKIRDMIDADLDDPNQRCYLLLSYFMESET